MKKVRSFFASMADGLLLGVCALALSFGVANVAMAATGPIGPTGKCKGDKPNCGDFNSECPSNHDTCFKGSVTVKQYTYDDCGRITGEISVTVTTCTCL